MLAWEEIFFCVGLIHAVYFCYAFMIFIYRHCLIDKKDMQARYGKGSWALVTGASDGIGAEYCIQLAQEGFNICLVSRTLSKLDAVQAKIKEISEVDTCVIQFDFDGATNMDQYEKLRQQTISMGMDIALLVINAGM